MRAPSSESAAESVLDRARTRRRRTSRGIGVALVAWYLLVSSFALFDGIELVERIAPRVKSVAAAGADAGFRCARHGCGCASEATCRERCCCEDGAAPSRAARVVTVHLLTALACHYGAQDGDHLAPALDPAAVSEFVFVVPPRVHAAVVVLHGTFVPALEAKTSDKVPIAPA